MFYRDKKLKRGKSASFYIVDIVLSGILLAGIIITGFILAFVFCAGKLFKGKKGSER